METDRFYTITIDDTDYETRITKKFSMRKPYKAVDPKKIFSIIPGTIVDLFVKSGEYVRIGQPLLILEAMKMKNTVNSPLDGKLKEVLIVTGEKVPKNHLMIVFE